MPNLKSIPGVTGGNSREHRVRSFLSRMPAEASRLLLSATPDEGKPFTLWEWSRAEVNEDLAPVVLMVLADHMESTEESEVAGLLAFVDKGDRVLASMVLKDRERDAATIATDSRLGLGTSPKDQVLQQMQQNERMHKLYIAGQATLQEQSFKLVDRVAKMNERLVEKLTEADQRIAEKEAELDAMAGMVRDAAAEAERATSEGGGGIDRAIATLMKVLPLVSAPRSLPRTPPAPTPPPAEGEPGA